MTSGKVVICGVFWLAVKKENNSFLQLPAHGAHRFVSLFAHNSVFALILSGRGTLV